MKISQWVRDTFRDFLVIFAAIMIIITVLRQIFEPDAAFDLKTVFIIMAFSFVGALTGFILYPADGISEKNMRARVIIHFTALEVILVSLAAVTGMVNNMAQSALLAAQIALVYVIVRLLSWQGDKKEADRINEKLKKFKEENR